MRINAAEATDGYKLDHRRQYEPGTGFVFSNLTARSSKLANIPAEAHDEKVVFFGLSQFIQRFLVEFWNENFFARPVEEVLNEYQRHINNYLGPNEIGTDHLRALHEYGRLPITIEAVPEGTRVPIQVPMMVFYNDISRPEFFWVTNYLETLISCEMWKPITSATTAFGFRRLIDRYCEETGGDAEFVPFQGHDFSFRGMSGFADACVSGTAHLTSFLGTDTVPAIGFAEQYYRASEDSTIIGMSVPASEHSVMCMGTKEREIETYRRFINDLYPTGIVSIVSDTWDYWKILTEGAVELKDDIMAREGKTVFRPDSGDPVKIICGYTWDGVDHASKAEAEESMREELALAASSLDSTGFDEYQYEVIKFDGRFYRVYADMSDQYGFDVEYEGELSEAEVKGSVEVLWDTFGGTVTEKGFKTLDSHVGLIYGDSITYQRCEAILSGLKAKGFSSDNLVFGLGSFTYQYVTRDTYGMAVKATFGIVNDERREIFKDPKTGSGKKSAKGYLRVKEVDGELVLEDEVDFSEFHKLRGTDGPMQVVFSNGAQINAPTLEDIRKRLHG